MKKDKLMPNFVFELMALEYRIKSLISPPENELSKLGFKKDGIIMDYGCGPGRYTIPLAELTAEKGQVVAVDIHPLAFKKVKTRVNKKNLKNVKVIDAENMDKLEEESFDAVILFDTLHDINDKKNTLSKINKTLKKEGNIYFKDHHISKSEINKMLKETADFILDEKLEEIMIFKKIK